MPRHKICASQLLRMYCEERMSQAEIAKTLGMSQHNVSYHLKKLNAPDPHLRGRNQWGENNPSYKDGMSRSTIGRTTKRVLSERDIDLRTCERCGTTYSDNLDRHHKDRNCANNSPDNIEVVCPACHAREHNLERQRDAWGRYL